MNEYLEASIKSQKVAGSETTSREVTVADKLQSQAQLLWQGTGHGVLARVQHPKDLLAESAGSALVAGGIGILSQKYKPVAIVASQVFKSALALDISARMLGTGYALADTWQNPENLDLNSRLLEKTVGAGLVDYSLMGIPAYGLFKGLNRYCDVTAETLSAKFAGKQHLESKDIPTLRQDFLTQGQPTFTVREQNPHLSNLYDEHRHASVRLRSGVSNQYMSSSSNGSGFFVDGKEGLIATSYHVVSGKKNVMVYTSEGEKFPARLIARDRDADIAILAPAQGVAVKEFPQVRLAAGTNIGAAGRFYNVGHPLGVRAEVLSVGKFHASNRFENRLAEGSSVETFKWSEPDTSLRKIASLEGEMGQFSASSGSAMFNDAGEVIGVFGFGSANIGGGTRVEHLHSLLKAVKEVKSPGGWLDVKTSARLTGEVNASGIHGVEVETLKVSPRTRLKLAQSINQRYIDKELTAIWEAEKAEPSLIGAAHSALGFVGTKDIAEFSAKLVDKLSNSSRKAPENEK